MWIETSRTRPNAWIVKNLLRIDCQHRGNQFTSHALVLRWGKASHCDFPHQSMQVYRISPNLRLALVADGFALNQRKSTQRGDRFIESFLLNRSMELVARLPLDLRKQEERDRFRRKQRCVDDQKLGTGTILIRL